MRIKLSIAEEHTALRRGVYVKIAKDANCARLHWTSGGRNDLRGQTVSKITIMWRSQDQYGRGTFHYPRNSRDACQRSASAPPMR